MTSSLGDFCLSSYIFLRIKYEKQYTDTGLEWPGGIPTRLIKF